MFLATFHVKKSVQFILLSSNTINNRHVVICQLIGENLKTVQRKKLSKYTSRFLKELLHSVGHTHICFVAESEIIRLIPNEVDRQQAVNHLSLA